MASENQGENTELSRKIVLAETQIESKPDSVESNFRYFGYLARYRTLIQASTRYLGYTSDVGEAFRPIVHPVVVRSAYAISWLYLLADVSYEGYKSHQVKPDPATTGLMVVKRSVFQGVATMLLPAVTIHSVVKYSAPLFQKGPNRLKQWGPTILGLGAVPFLPFLFDHPVEKVVDTAFDLIEEKYLEKSDAEKTPALSPSDPTYNSKQAAVVEQIDNIIAKEQRKQNEREEREIQNAQIQQKERQIEKKQNEKKN
eukprot:TRINITY_DN818_c0_g1_i1.p2 TRINITY_DN818_c0_g1~~TRINITY_DN818_c0_g1_i1.p2  ORF type:complete len:256 (-),score=82.86 TRINITY_DN818_c0_g1_i1:884-1651(-)